MDKKKYKKMLDDLCTECCCDSNHYCFLKEFVMESHPSPRLLIQIKLIEKYKYEMSEREDRDVGWTEAIESWASEGYAERFAKYYSEDKSYKTLYKEVITNNEAIHI